MSPAPIVITTSPGRASSSNVAMIRSRSGQNAHGLPRRNRKAPVPERANRRSRRRSRGPRRPAQSATRRPASSSRQTPGIKRARARDLVRLEDAPQPPPAESFARGPQGRPHFRRMVRVIVDECHAAPRSDRARTGGEPRGTGQAHSTMSAGETPRCSHSAIAASALSTLCRPGTLSENSANKSPLVEARKANALRRRPQFRRHPVGTGARAKTSRRGPTSRAAAATAAAQSPRTTRIPVDGTRAAN